MITIFNRKELFTTYSMEKQAALRQALADAGIDYTVQTMDRSSPSPFSAGSRGRMGTFGTPMERMLTYVIYVKKKDYEYAQYILRNLS